MGQRRFFTEEFKAEAVRLMTEQGMPISQVSRDLGVDAGVLRRWRRKHEGLPPRSSPSSQSVLPEPDELRRLRRENEQLRLEREILKKALGIFTVRSR
jgi:transposase